MSLVSDRPGSFSTFFTGSPSSISRTPLLVDATLPEMRHIEVVVRRVLRSGDRKPDPLRQRIQRVAGVIDILKSRAEFPGTLPGSPAPRCLHSGPVTLSSRIARRILKRLYRINGKRQPLHGDFGDRHG